MSISGTLVDIRDNEICRDDDIRDRKLKRTDIFRSRDVRFLKSEIYIMLH